MWIVKYKKETLQKQPLNLNGYYIDLKEGFSYLRKTKIVFSICIFGALLGILVIPINTLSVAFVNAELNLGPEAISIINFSSTIGMLIGSFLFPKFREAIKGIKLFILSGSILGLMYMSYSFATLIASKVLIYIFLATLPFIFGISASIMLSLINVSFMENIDNQYLGRVAGVFNSLVTAATPAGSLLVSALCIFLTTSQLYFVFGIFTLILFLVQVYNKGLQEI